jgi:RNA polymerase sigma factor (sigma-70 family)
MPEVPLNRSGATTESPIESTQRLLARANAGDQDAIERLFARCLPPLRRWASGRLPRWARDMADTQDLVQETVLNTFRRLGQFEPRHEGALQAYLRQALMNRIRDELRRSQRRPPPDPLGGDHVNEDASPLEIAIGRQTLERYETALERLRPEDREAIVGRVELGMSYDELADALSKPSRDAARMAVARALMRLAGEMGHHGV